MFSEGFEGQHATAPLSGSQTKKQKEGKKGGAEVQFRGQLWRVLRGNSKLFYHYQGIWWTLDI